MAGKLDCYNLGSMGVNVDKNPIELEDGELTKSQNAIHDPLGSMGGLRKRPGLTKLNSVAAAGAINGAIGVPIVVGSAGNDGGLTPSPAVTGTITLIEARRISAATAGWNTSTDIWATGVTTGGPDGYSASATPRVPDNLWPSEANTGDTFDKMRAVWSGRPGCMFKNRFYYAGNDYTLGSTVPTLRMWDGTTDYLLNRVPFASKAVIDMIAGGDGLIYMTVLEAGIFSSNTLQSRILQMNPNTGVVKQIGSAFPKSPETVRVPFSLCWHQGKLWTRTHGAGISAVSHSVYYIRPDVDSDWTTETGDSGTTGTNFLLSYSGQLFYTNYADFNVAGAIRVRSPLAVVSTSFTPSLIESGVTSMAAFGYGNGFTCGAVFGGNLYMAYWNQEGIANNNTGDLYARIYKFDGTSWSAVFGPAANNASCVPYNHAFVTGGKLYFVSAPARTNVNTAQRILYTADGSAFTAVSGVLTSVSGGFMGAIVS